VLRPAGLIVSELVDNAVRHAGTTIVLTVSRRGVGLHLAVNDDDPELPILAGPASQRPGESREDSHGLRAVHTAAAVWGAMPTSTGKVVWALVRPDRS
jgi:anti-sigma regulatory factor (Ser/Thr protein kinase)